MHIFVTWITCIFVTCILLNKFITCIERCFSMLQQFPMHSAFLLLRQLIVVLLLSSPPLTNSPPQLLAVKHNVILWTLQWLAFGYVVAQVHRCHCYPLPTPWPWPKTQYHWLQAPRVLSQTLQSHIRKYSRPSFFQIEARVFFVSPFSRLFDHLRTGRDVKAISPKLY